MTHRVKLSELRAAAVERDEGEPEGHVCMTGDYALALVEAVEAANAAHTALVNSGVELQFDAVMRLLALRDALARFDFSEGDAS